MALPLRKFGSNYRPSSSSVQGINVVPAVIDPNFTLEIKIVVQPPLHKTVQIHAGQHHSTVGCFCITLREEQLLILWGELLVLGLVTCCLGSGNEGHQTNYNF